MRRLTLMLLLCACDRPETARIDPAEPQARAEEVAAPPFVVVDATPAAGPLEAQLRAHVQRARIRRLRPFAELGATWCPPCRAIEQSMDDPLMRTAFRGTYIVRIDIDELGRELGPLGLSAPAIPKFIELRDDGHGSGRAIDGSAWGEDIPANMAPVLDRYFHF
ncbi:MAG: thioredoxin family protein [Sandaracinaceae bacterium]|nr:thioredoxin family protein [Sandaracinaceae bacterium]